MIMLSYKTKAMGYIGAVNTEGKDSPSARLLAQLQEGLQMVLGALRNYSMAYEALGGMRDQIESSLRSISTTELDGVFNNQIMG